MHNEIHNVKKPSEALPSQGFQVVAKSIQRARAGKGHTMLLDQTTKGTVPSSKGLAARYQDLIGSLSRLS